MTKLVWLMSVFVYILLRCIENRLVFTVNVNDFHANELLLQLLLLIKKNRQHIIVKTISTITSK